MKSWLQQFKKVKVLKINIFIVGRNDIKVRDKVMIDTLCYNMLRLINALELTV